MEQTITAKQIHQDFFEAEDRLYVEAIGLSKAILTSQTDKSKRLQGLGFGKSKPVKDCQETESKRKVCGHTINVIEHFRQHYPNNKFITEAEVKRLCEKYGLVLGEAGNYIGDVPEKNLREIEKFVLRKEDYKEVEKFSWVNYLSDESAFTTGLWFNSRSRPIDREYENYKQQLMNLPTFLVGADPYKEEKPKKKKETTTEKPSFKICAPKEDFHTFGYEIKDGYRLVYDPIVLQPVSKEGIEGYLIVTAWGDEASDENVVNEKMN